MCVLKDIAEYPVIIGDELCGKIIEVGKRWSPCFKKRDNFSVQSVLDPAGSYVTIDYSFGSVDGDAELTLIPDEVIEYGVCFLTAGMLKLRDIRRFFAI